MNRVLLLGAAVALSVGCASSRPPTKVEVVEVKIPVVIPPPEIELPPMPKWESPNADPEDSREYIRAMVRDLLNAWAHIEELRWLIETTNEATRAADD